MAKPAGGKHPPNVSAVIITEEERRDKLAEAPPGAGGGVGPGATVTSEMVVTPTAATVEEQIQATSDQLIGRAAIIAAQKCGLPYVWSTTTKKKITLDSAETLIKKNPGFVYFDFDALEEIAAITEREQRELDQEYDESDEIEYVDENDDEVDDTIADMSDPAVMAELEQSAELVIDKSKNIPEVADDPLATESEIPTVSRSEIVRQTRQDQIDRIKAEVEQETMFDQPAPAHRITETERRAWGGTLSTPGMQVYIHPKGIARVDVVGRVKLQTGVSGNVRIFRIQALEKPPVGGVVRNVSHQTVTGPKAKSPNPATQRRQMQDDKIPIPVPPKADLDEGTDY